MYVDSNTKNASVFVDFDEKIGMKNALIVVNMKICLEKYRGNGLLGKDIIMLW